MSDEARDLTGKTLMHSLTSDVWRIHASDEQRVLLKEMDGSLAASQPMSAWNQGTVVFITNDAGLRLRGVVAQGRATCRIGADLQAVAVQRADGAVEVACLHHRKDEYNHTVVREVPWHEHMQAL